MSDLFVKGHSLTHCWHMDTPWTTAGLTAYSLVCALYLLVAVRSWVLSEHCASSLAKWQYRLHVGVFLLCALCGYAFELLAYFDHNYYRLRVCVLYVLLVVTLLYLRKTWYVGVEVFDVRARALAELAAIEAAKDSS